MRLDGATVAAFKARAAAGGGSYQTLINEALREYLAGHNLANIVREAAEQAARRGCARGAEEAPGDGPVTSQRPCLQVERYAIGDAQSRSGLVE